MKNIHNKKAFTIVELIVVIAVVGILAGIILVSYGAWRSAVATSSLKSDLEQVASVIESSRTFDNSYPLSIPTLFSPSSGNTITLTIPGTKSFCIDGQTSQSASIKYYIDDLIQSNGATAGTCATRTSLPVPGVVTNVAFTADSVAIVVNWTLAAPNYADRYLAQCALDPGFVTGLLEATVSGGASTTATLSGVSATSAYFCHVRAMNANGQSKWSNTGTGETQQQGCADTSQYGTFPDCYDYDSIPPGTSIAGFWSTPPPGYIFEDGSAISRTTYADLFALFGTTYGVGNGTTTFNVPDSRGRATVNLNAADAEFNVIGEKYGEKLHSITTNEIPSHAHPQNVSANNGGSAVRNDYSSDVRGSSYAQGLNTANAGGNAASNVIQPSIVKRYAIKWRAITGTDSTLASGTTLQGYWATPPLGYSLENGSAISRTTYANLYSIIGVTYGSGNGSTTFTLPNSQGRLGVNRNPSDTQFATLGQVFGEKRHTLTIAEMASHSHVQYITANSGGSAIRNDYSSDAAGQAYSQGILTGSTGGGQAFNVIQPSIVKASTIKTAASAGGSDDAGIVPGTSIEGWWSSAPAGFLLEDGTAVSRTTYAALFTVIGTAFGAGNGTTTFNLPDSRGRVVVNLNTGDTQFATLGQKFGEKTHIMSLAELPAHSHEQYVSANAGPSLRTDYKYDSSGGTYSQNISTDGAGSSAAYNVIQPSITKMFAIKY